jgi:hypothetical protein
MTIKYLSNHHILFWLGAGAVTIGQTINMRNDMKLLPPDFTEAVIIHETVHTVQYKKFGTWGFIWRYFLRPAFRREMELAAYTAELNYYIRKGYNRDLATYLCAVSLSSSLYFRMMSPVKAYLYLSALSTKI